MEQAVVQWQQEEEVAEVGLHGRRPRQSSQAIATSTVTVTAVGNRVESSNHEELNDKYKGYKGGNEEVTISETGKLKLLEAQVPAATSSINRTAENINQIQDTDLHLDSVYKKQVAHDFLCPNCNSSIEKVIVRVYKTDSEPIHTLECTSCFSFLPLVENDWLRKLLRIEDGGIYTKPDTPPADDSESHPSTIIPIPSEDEPKVTPKSRDNKKLEILKSIVYGGLTESVTSLTVVTSAASANATTLNIVALSLANLVGGLLIIGHNLRELKNEQPKGTSDQTNEQVDQYREQLGQKQNFIIHATVAFISFVIFGLVPPLVYGFSFRKSDNNDYKLAAVAAASLLCIIMLAICKAYVQEPPKNYIKTVMYYAVAGIMASGVAYLAGDLIGKLIENFGWFNSEDTVTTIPLDEKSSGRHAWASY